MTGTAIASTVSLLESNDFGGDSKHGQGIRKKRVF
jgi:hypothetical protein